MLAVASVLAACGDGGFRPVHGDIGIAANVSEKLKQVDVATIPSRVGQQVRNELIFATTGGGTAETAVYRLEIAIRERLTSALVEKTGEARSRIYVLDANFKLVSIKDKKVLLTGTSYARAGLETYKSIFSNVRARRDAEDRAARTVGADIKTRVSAFLASPV
ncbi:MAG: LPS assembly lipoprotein LptE [Hyphomicrobiaceae bacterium]|nr:LPS assembly lipoprotein LptE [Hyphomicrobiaceae bacterium]